MQLDPRNTCDRVLWLHDGQIAGDGDPDEVVEEYRAVAHEEAHREFARRFALLESQTSARSGVTVDKLVATTGPGAAAVHLFRLDEPFCVEAVVSSKEAHDVVRVRLDLVRVDGILVFRDERELKPHGRHHAARDLARSDARLGRFTYRLRLELVSRDGESLAKAETAFAVEDHLHAFNSSYYQDVEWSLPA